MERLYPPVPLETLRQLAAEADPSVRRRFQVAETVRPRPERMALACSLFAKPRDQKEPGAEPPVDTEAGGEWWDRYLEPFLHFLREDLAGRWPGFKAIVFLEPTLRHLVPLLLGASELVEVRIMKDESVGHSPGACWRLLAAGDRSLDLVAMTDIDAVQEPLPFLASVLDGAQGYGASRLLRQVVHEFAEAKKYVLLWAGETVFRPSEAGLEDIEDLLVGYAWLRQQRCASAEPLVNRDGEEVRALFGPEGKCRTGSGSS